MNNEPKIGEIWLKRDKNGKHTKRYRVESVHYYWAIITPLEPPKIFSERAWWRHFEEGKFIREEKQ